MSIRAVWITIRAIDYASQVFSSIQKSVETLKQKETALSKENDRLRQTALKAAEASIMMATLSSQLAGSIFNMAMKSRQGAGDMARLNQQMFLTSNALNNAAYEFLKVTGILDFLNNALRAIERNPALSKLIIGLMAVGAVLTAGVAIYFAYVAITSLAAIKTFALAKSQQTLLVPINKVTAAWKTQAMAVGLAFGAFAVFFTIASQFHGVARIVVSAIMIIVGALILLATWQAMTTGGLSTLAGTAGVISVGAIAAGSLGIAGEATGTFASGTQSVQKTGPVFAHKGEVIYNPATNRPLQIGNDINKNAGGNVTNMNTQITIENVHTKADFDDVAYQINKANRMGARSVR